VNRGERDHRDTIKLVMLTLQFGRGREHYRRRLAEERITCSMSRRGNCWDNAPMESFFASLKKELIHHEDYATREQARASVFEYIEAFYNRARRHSALGYVAPAEYERTHNQQHR
jgi:transposase InsO family protein